METGGSRSHASEQNHGQEGLVIEVIGSDTSGQSGP